MKPFRIAGETPILSAASTCTVLTSRSAGNLYDFLTARRSATEVLKLWIDAVCINQRDLTEKNAQVQQMGKIYRQAPRLRIWLGPSTADMHLAMEYLGRVDEDESLAEDGPQFIVKDLSQELNEDPAKIRTAVLELLGRSWFEWVWIVQEIALYDWHDGGDAPVV